MIISRPRFAFLTVLAVLAGFVLDELSIRFDVTGLVIFALSGGLTFCGGYWMRWQTESDEIRAHQAMRKALEK